MSGFGPPTPSYLDVGWVDVMDGAIVGVGSCPPDALEGQWQRPGTTRHYILAADSQAIATDMRRYWLSGDQVVGRVPSSISLTQSTIAADGMEEVAITGIPLGSRLSASGAVSIRSTLITSEEVTLTSSQIGKIRLSLACPAPYLDWSGEVDAV